MSCFVTRFACTLLSEPKNWVSPVVEEADLFDADTHSMAKTLLYCRGRRQTIIILLANQL